MLLCLIVDQTVTSTHAAGYCNIFFNVYTQKIIYVKTFFFKFKVLYVVKAHFNCFHNQVNNLDDMEREQFFVDIKKYFEKFKGWLLAGEEIL